MGLFAVGLAPKSTSDPYGLRRAALGIIQILLDQSIAVDLRALIARVAQQQPLDVSQQMKGQILEFIAGRFENWLNETYPYPRDVVNAVLRAQAHDPARALKGIHELAGWVARDHWESILDSFARCVRITRGEIMRVLDPAIFEDEWEYALYESYQSEAAGLCDAGTVDDFLSAFERMVPAVTDFFDNVLVHADDPALRNNRIALLQRISAMQAGRADLSELENF